MSYHAFGSSSGLGFLDIIVTSLLNDGGATEMPDFDPKPFPPSQGAVQIRSMLKQIVPSKKAIEQYTPEELYGAVPAAIKLLGENGANIADLVNREVPLLAKEWAYYKFPAATIIDRTSRSTSENALRTKLTQLTTPLIPTQPLFKMTPVAIKALMAPKTPSLISPSAVKNILANTPSSSVIKSSAVMSALTGGSSTTTTDGDYGYVPWIVGGAAVLGVGYFLLHHR